MKRQTTKKLALVAIGLFFSLCTQAQSSYNDYGYSDKTFKYREDFSNSSSKWETVVEGKSRSNIRDGVLVFRSLNDKAQAKYAIVSGLDWNGDWEVEIRVRWVNGEESSSIDLIWDRTQGKTEKYHFGFTAARKYNIARYDNGYQQIVDFTQADFVYKTTRNRLTVRKVGGYFYFFFNERFVKSHPSRTITGDYIGFMVPPSSVIEVDYLYAFQLKNRSISASSSGSSSKLLGGNNYVGVMTKYSGLSTQRWKTRDVFPKDDIASDWDAGYYISDASYDNDKWSIVMSKGTGYTQQTWKTRKEWAKDEIKEMWDQGYRITELNYGNGVWAYVFSKGSGYGRQRWATKGSAFPSDKIREFGDDGLWITEVVYGKDRWAVVGSKDDRIRNQKWFKRSNFPEDDIDTYTKQGYAITQLSYENNWWVLVMSKYSSNRYTKWFNTASFPKDEIRKYWDQGYHLTDVTYGRTGSSNMSSSRSNETKKRFDVKSKLLGRWYGGASGEDKGYFTFYSDGIVKMVVNGETIGGYDYVQDGVKIDLKYETNSLKTPNQLDLVFKSYGQEFGKIRGIIRFIDDDTFELKMALELNDARPVSFTSTSQYKVATFKRVR